MPTLERQLELEGRAVKVLVTALLISWFTGLITIGKLVAINVKNQELSEQFAEAMWLAEDQKLAVETCYRGRWATWRKDVAHVDADPKGT